MLTLSRTRDALTGRLALPALVLFLGSAGLFGANPVGANAAAAIPEAGVWQFTDLDGDLHPDQVRSTDTGLDRQGYVYTVEFKMSAGTLSSPIRVHGPDEWGLDIVSRDVDGDHDLDLVVTGGPFQQPLGVWINDGHGGFTQADILRYPAAIWFRGTSFASPFAPAPAAAVLIDTTPAAGTLDLAPLPDSPALQLHSGSESVARQYFFTSSARPRAPPLLLTRHS